MTRSRTDVDDADVDEMPGEVEPPTGPRAQRDLIDAQCLSLRRTGATHREIAQTLNVSVARAHRGCERARLAEGEVDPKVVRADLLGVLDRATVELSRIITTSSNQDRQLRAVAQLVAVADRKAKLVGADAPVVRTLDVTVFTREALDAEQARLERELEAAGVDVTALPSVDDIAGIIEATATVSE